MAVKVCGNVVGRMPQLFLDLFHGNSVCQQKTCTAVAEVVKAQRLKPVLSDHKPEMIGHIVWRDELSRIITADIFIIRQYVQVQ